MERINNKNKNNYKVVSLFSGIGGFDLGFINAGFNVIWANDIDKYAVETYRANIGSNILLGDIREVKKNIPPHDVLIGGFPCQPFSTLGKLKGFEDEERGTLFFEIKEILEKYKTKIVVLENVKNLTNHNRGETFKKMLKELDDIGYYCYHDILNTADFGIPQRRNRVFLVAFNKKIFINKKFKFPLKIGLNCETHDILDKKVEEKYFISKKIYPTIMGEGTMGYKVKPTINQKISKTLTATMHKMHRASQDNYFIDKKNHKCCDGSKTNLRRLTPNECRILQGFPSDWKQVVSDTQAYKQFGNAVTVDVAYHLARKINSYCANSKVKKKKKNKNYI